MRLTIIVILILFYSFSKGQTLTIDSLNNLYNGAMADIRDGSPDHAAIVFSKIISDDSTYFKIYFLRALSYLMDSELSISDTNGLLIHGFNDTSLIKKGIYDLDKCIQLYFLNPKVFPDGFLDNVKDAKMEPSGRLGDLSYLNDVNRSIVNGVLTYIGSNKKNKSIACDYWEKAQVEKVYKIEVLINEFCK